MKSAATESVAKETRKAIKNLNDIKSLFQWVEERSGLDLMDAATDLTVSNLQLQLAYYKTKGEWLLCKEQN